MLNLLLKMQEVETSELETNWSRVHIPLTNLPGENQTLYIYIELHPHTGPYKNVLDSNFQKITDKSSEFLTTSELHDSRLRTTNTDSIEKLLPLGMKKFSLEDQPFCMVSFVVLYNMKCV